MIDLTTLAAQRCAELANEMGGSDTWKPYDFFDHESTPDSRAFRHYVEQAHHLATAAIAKHPDLANDLAGMILVEPVMEEARAVWSAAYLAYEGAPARNGLDHEVAIAVIADALRQRSDANAIRGGGHG